MSPASYTNPVYPRSFPDPFVLKVRGEYWAYCTGFWSDGRCFGVLRSRDLVDWTPQAGALAPLPGDHPCYWAPEVAEHNGLFYLYYSVGNEERMEIRVAVADHPAGPFNDSGHRLTSEPFAIDAHVFTDPSSGARYLFYATDFLEGSHVGTGTVVDRLLDPFTLEGGPRPVALPRYDWHVYHPNRPEKGGVRWHTVEGPFVLEHKGLYYEMFSGGNWQNPTYGMSYATIASLDGPGEWVQAADGERVLPILRTAGEVVGPGHNSVVRGPDNRQLWCVYHRWSFDGGARVMAIDPLDWAGERLLVLGPTTTPRPVPIPPTIYKDAPGATLFDAGATSFLVEVSARGEGFGLEVRGDDGPVWRLLVRDEARVSWRGGEGGWSEQRLALPAGFSPHVFHLLRLDLDDTRVDLTIDEAGLRWTGRLAAPASAVALVADGLSQRSGPARRESSPPGPLSHLPPTRSPGEGEIRPGGVAFLPLSRRGEGGRWERGPGGEDSTRRSRPFEPSSDEVTADFAGLALTVGWEELFLLEGDPASLGWQSLHSAYEGMITKGRLRLAAGSSLLVRGPALSAYLLVVNARLDEESERGWTIHPAIIADDPGPELNLERRGEAWVLAAREAEAEHLFLLPEGFDPFADQQIRLRRERGLIEVEWEGVRLGEITTPPGPSRVGIGTAGGAVSFEMVRVTALPGI